MSADRYDVIIIGTGAGGGTLARRLAPSGKRILLLERGSHVPREKDNWSPKVVNLDGKYQAKEVWHDKDGKELHPHTNYNVGGNTKFYGAALFRLRKQDFGELRHHGGVSPAWAVVRICSVVGSPIAVTRRRSSSATASSARMTNHEPRQPL